jgi:hypothetical protein
MAATGYVPDREWPPGICGIEVGTMTWPGGQAEPLYCTEPPGHPEDQHATSLDWAE